MTKYQQFEVIKSQIHHPSAKLTLNQAIALIMLETIPLFKKEEKLKISVVICKLEFFRINRLYREEMGEKLYKLLCDIFQENTIYQQIDQVEAYLDQELARMQRKITPQQYDKLALTVSRYFQISPVQYQKDLQHYFAQGKSKSKPKEASPAPVVATPSKATVTQKHSFRCKLKKNLRRNIRKIRRMIPRELHISTQPRQR